MTSQNELTTTDLFLCRSSLETTIIRLQARYDNEGEVAIPAVIRQYQNTLDRITAILNLELAAEPPQEESQ